MKTKARFLSKNTKRAVSVLVTVSIILSLFTFVPLTATASGGPGADLLLSAFNVLGDKDFRRSNLRSPFTTPGRAAFEALDIARYTGDVGETVASYVTGKNMLSFSAAQGVDISYKLELNLGYKGALAAANTNNTLTGSSNYNDSYKGSYESFFSKLQIYKKLGTNYVPQSSLRYYNQDIWGSSLVSGGMLEPAFKQLLAEGNIDDLFRQYGTHIVTHYNLGAYAENTMSTIKTDSAVTESIEEKFGLDSKNTASGSGLNAAVNANIDTKNKIDNTANTEGFSKNIYSVIHGGTIGAAAVLDPETSLAQYETWLNSVNSSNPADSCAIFLDGSLELIGIWELLPDTYAARKEELKKAYLAKADVMYNGFYDEFIYSPLSLQSEMPKPVIDNDFIFISTAEQLNNIRNNLSGKYILTNDIDLSGYAEWTPIGTAASPFTGVLDGNGNTVKGVKVVSGSPNPGLIGVNNGTIKTLAVIYASRAGGVAGINNGTVTNCYTDWDFISSYTPSITTVANIPTSVTAEGAIIDLSAISGTSIAANRTIIVGNDVKIIKFKGALNKTFTGLNIVIMGNTDVIFENFNYNGTAGSSTIPALRFDGTNPAIISLGSTILGYGNYTNGTGSRAVLESAGNLYICGKTNISVAHTNSANTNGAFGKSAIYVSDTLDIAIEAQLIATGGSGFVGTSGGPGTNINSGAKGSDGANGSPGKPGGDGTNVTAIAGNGNPGNTGGNGGNAVSASKVNIMNVSQVYLTGGKGGDGGAGGAGGIGGKGGDGGNGGSWSHWISGSGNGGAGGHGGNGGRGGNGGVGGTGGNGGTPLDVSVQNFTRSSHSYLSLSVGTGGIGGRGGNGGVGGAGGAGGNGGRSGNVSGTCGTGGNGGNGGRGGDTGASGIGGCHGLLDVVGGINNMTGLYYGSPNGANGTPGNGGARGDRGIPWNGQINGQFGNYGIVGINGNTATNPTPRPSISNSYLIYANGTPSNFDKTIWLQNRLIIDNAVRIGYETENIDHKGTLIYHPGELFDISGLDISLKTAAGSVTKLSNNNLDLLYDFSEPGNTLVTVSYYSAAAGGRLVRHIPVKVVPAEIISVEQKNPKMIFFTGDKYNIDGLAWEVRYCGGGFEILTAADLTVSHPDGFTPGMILANDHIGNFNITVTHPNIPSAFWADKNYDITVIDLVPVAMHIINQPTKQQYYVGDTFNPSGMTMQLELNNGSRIPLPISDVEFIPSLFDRPGTPTTVTARYKNTEKAVPDENFTVEKVLPDDIKEYQVISWPKQNYFEDEYFAPNGFVVEVERLSGRISRLQWADFEFTPPEILTEPLKTTDTRARARYAYGAGLSDYIQIDIPLTVVRSAQTGIRINYDLVKTSYIEGQQFDPTGLTVWSEWNNSVFDAEIPSSGYDYNPKTLSVDAEFITVTSGAFTAPITIPITVIPKVHAQPPVIEAQPQNESVYVDARDEINVNHEFFVEAYSSDGGTLSYQWYSNTANSNTSGTLMPGATNATYTASANAAGTKYYYVEITNTISDNGDGGNKVSLPPVKSDVAKLTITAQIHAQTPNITTQPQDASIVESSVHSFAVTATKSDSGTLSYQWYKSTIADISDLSGYDEEELADILTEISGATNTSYSPLTNTIGTYYYFVVVTNTIADNDDGGEKEAFVISRVATLDVGAHVHTGGTATCTEKAVCTFPGCGESYGSPLGHNYSATFTVDTAATCTTAGSQSKHCSRCDSKTEITPIPALGHTGGTATCTEKAICTRCTEAYGNALGHNYSTTFTVDAAATCTTAGSQSRHCSRCDSKTAITPIPALGHTGGTATCTEKAVCSRCSIAYGEPLGHNYSATFTTDIAATCTTAGSQSRHCSRCDSKTAITSIPALGHTGGTANCTEKAVCSRCHEAYGNALGHNYLATFTVDSAATCTTAGSQSKHCSRCDSKTEVTSVPALGHIGGTATCTEKAVCTRCSVAYGNALGHDYATTFTIDTAAKCETEGSKSHHCLRCDAKTDVTAIPATSHSWSAWVEVTPATFNTEGLEKHTCSICGKEETRSIPKLKVINDDKVLVDGDYIFFSEAMKQADFLKCFENAGISIYDKNGNPLKNDSPVGSGATLVLKNGKEYTVILLGDINGDGNISAADARLVLRASARLDTLNEWQTLAADVNADGNISASDARRILRVSARLDTPDTWLQMLKDK